MASFKNKIFSYRIECVEFKKDLSVNNLFVFDVKYSNTFSKNKRQNDELFYVKFEDLKLYSEFKNGQKSDISSNAANESGLSLKEDNFINTDVLKLLDASNVNTKIILIFINFQNLNNYLILNVTFLEKRQ